jgi:HEAT repeat protein
LTDSDLHVRTIAAQSLGEIHPADEAIVAKLILLLATDDREIVIRPLSGFGSAAKAAVPNLIEVLKGDSNSRMRWEAARTLGKIGPAAKPAVSALIQATMDHDALVREHAAEALGDIGPEAAEGIPALIVALEDP